MSSYVISPPPPPATPAPMTRPQNHIKIDKTRHFNMGSLTTPAAYLTFVFSALWLRLRLAERQNNLRSRARSKRTLWKGEPKLLNSFWTSVWLFAHVFKQNESSGALVKPSKHFRCWFVVLMVKSLTHTHTHSLPHWEIKAFWNPVLVLYLQGC